MEKYSDGQGKIYVDFNAVNIIVNVKFSFDSDVIVGEEGKKKLK